MPSVRTIWRLALVAALTLAGCSSPGSVTGDSGGDDSGGPNDANPDGGLTVPDGGPPPTGLFPLTVAADGSSLVAHDGSPFLLHGEAAWSLIVQLSTSDAMQYLADRRTRGVNAIIVNLIEHFYSERPPQNSVGAAPFTTRGDFSTPNEAYFAHADQVIDLAASQGIAVLLFPSYLGKGVEEGWREEMTAMGAVAGAPKCASYGAFLGQRYASKKNIIWVWGGDETPTGEPEVETCLKAIRDGILGAAGTGTLSSGHWEPESTSRDEPAFASALSLVGVYTYKDILAPCQRARNTTPRKPVFLFETCYENETYNSCGGTAAEIRRRQWWGLLGCGAGEISGNNPIWLFDSGWPQALTSAGSNSQVRLVTLARSVRWQTLALDNALIVADNGTGYAEVAAARTTDAGDMQAVIYFPPDLGPAIPSPAIVTVDLARMQGAVTATWHDPSAVRSMPAGTGLTGRHAFSKPGKNAGGDTDWVLVLTSP